MVQVDLITGFLGAGKTTFLRRYAAWWAGQGVKVCVLENDFGAVNVDAMLVQTEHRYVCKHAGSIRFNGRSVGTIIGFEAVGCRFIPNLRIPQSSQKLQFTRKSVIRIEVIVPSSQRYQVFTIYRTAEPFVRIIVGIRYL